MPLTKRFLTEFTNRLDGQRYAGPQILSDCVEAAEAMRQTSLLGPNGEPLRVMGELIQQMPAEDGGVYDYIRTKET